MSKCDHTFSDPNELTCDQCGKVIPPLERVKMLADDLVELRQTIGEYDRLLTRLGNLLTDTAEGLKGKPDDLVWHDWADLPAVAERVKTENGRLKKILEVLAARTLPPWADDLLRPYRVPREPAWGPDSPGYDEMGQ